MLARFAIFSAIVATFVGVCRVVQFGQLELVSDQAFFTQWVLRLANADHFFPDGIAGQGWFQALMQDEESFLNVLIRQIYQAQALLFTIVSVLLFTLGSLLIGASMEGVVAISIAISAVSLWLLALFPVLFGRHSGAQESWVVPCAVGAMVLLIGGANSFFNVFSAMGPHNSGVMFLLLATLVTQKWLGGVAATGLLFADRRITMLMFAVQLLAVYAHYTNVFLIAPATVIALALDPALRPGRRLGIIIRYSASAFLMFVPALALIALYNNISGSSANDQSLAGIAQVFVLTGQSTGGDNIGDWAGLWFRNMGEIYTVPGLILGVIGVCGIAWFDRRILPLAIVLVHFLVGSLMPVFGQYDRTAAYVLPMLMLGGAWLVVRSVYALVTQWHAEWRRAGVAGLCAIFVLVAGFRHALTEYARLVDPSTVYRWGQLTGNPVWRPVVSEIASVIPRGGVLLPWDYGLSHQFRSMSERSGRDLRVLRPLETLVSHRVAGTLREYIDTRGLTFSGTTPIFVLVPGDMTPETLTRSLQSVFDVDGFRISKTPAVIPRLAWVLPRDRYLKTSLHLYEVVWQ